MLPCKRKLFTLYLCYSDYSNTRSSISGLLPPSVSTMSTQDTDTNRPEVYLDIDQSQDSINIDQPQSLKQLEVNNSDQSEDSEQIDQVSSDQSKDSVQIEQYNSDQSGSVQEIEEFSSDQSGNREELNTTEGDNSGLVEGNSTHVQRKAPYESRGQPDDVGDASKLSSNRRPDLMCNPISRYKVYSI